MNRQPAPDDELRGWIYKWTNYIKGYQKRWLVLHNGTLAYYRNQGECHTCRGAINLQGAFIHTENSLNFVVSGGTQTFHLKASNEVERQRWVTALELARVRAIKAAESDEEEELKFEQQEEAESKSDLQATLRSLHSKINDLVTCQDLIAKHGSGLQKSLAELEQMQSSSTKVKTVNERSTLFRITTNAMINACNEFVSLAQLHGRKWQRLLQHEHQQRVQLQEQLEQLARQHSKLERAALKDMKDQGKVPMGTEIYTDSEDETQFHDAAEDVNELSKFSKGETSKRRTLKRSDSGVSGASGAGLEDDDGSQDEREGAAAYFSAEIVTRKQESPGEQRKGFNQQQQRRGTPTPPPTPPPEVKKNPARIRRKRIPLKGSANMSLWSIMKNCIGKELSKIPMPVNFNEPLSMLQRLTEDLEYSSILDKAAGVVDSLEQLCYVAAFAASSYATTTNRTGKPFNPLLGETFEADRRDDLGWRTICEQVSHHPPAAAQYTEGNSGWRLWQEFTMSSKFRGKYLSVIPLGICHLEFQRSGNHYTWRKVTTTVHNIIVGKLWIDNHGEMTIENHRTGEKCHLKYVAYSYFSRETPRKVTGVVKDKSGSVKWVVQGTWDDHIDCAKVVSQSDQKSQGKPVFETLQPKTIWRRNPILPGSDAFYNFTQLGIELNEMEEGVAPTDSRRRPDQRLMEQGDWDKANQEKVRLEEKQRAVRRRKEAEAEKAMLEGKTFKDYDPLWFVKQKDQQTGNVTHMYTGQYWKAKEKQDWSKCPDIF